MSSKKQSNIKSFVNKHQRLAKILLIVAIFAAISLISTLILSLTGVIYFDDGIQINQELFDHFKTTWYGYVLIVLIQIAITSFLSFVPGISMAFIVLLQTLLESPILSFSIAFTGVLLTSFMLYIIGRFGGYTLCKKLLGEEDCQKASDLLNNKGTIYFPIMMLFPIFPDDALVMVAGTLKMSLKWFIPSIVICRGIGVATIVFGVSITENFTTPWHWIGFILICAVGIVSVFYAASRFNKFMEKKRNQNND